MSASLETRAALGFDPVTPAPRLPRRLRQRGRAVRAAKYALPVLALALLSAIALWPELSRTMGGRVSWHRALMEVAGGTMRAPHYRGVDGRNQPYMVSADTGVQVGPERVNLVAPIGDVTQSNGTWLQVRSRNGVFIQHINQLDLAGDVTLYRGDGTTIVTQSATIDLKRSAGTSDEWTHAEGPFGMLDAEGFTLVDKGGIVQFHGPAKLILNETK